jgi:excisionase family DNA binding protein
MSTEQITLLLERLERIEQTLQALVVQRTVKQFYTTAEVAEIVGRSEYTVREYCRKGQIQAEKAPNGRGWLVPHAELERLRNYGAVPA